MPNGLWFSSIIAISTIRQGHAWSMKVQVITVRIPSFDSLERRIKRGSFNEIDVNWISLAVHFTISSSRRSRVIYNNDRRPTIEAHSMLSAQLLLSELQVPAVARRSCLVRQLNSAIDRNRLLRNLFGIGTLSRWNGRDDVVNGIYCVNYRDWSNSAL